MGLKAFSSTRHIVFCVKQDILKDKNSEVSKQPKMFGIQKLRELEQLSQQKRKPKKETRRRMRKNDKNETTNILSFFIVANGF